MLFYWVERTWELRTLALQLRAKRNDEEFTPEAPTDPEKFLGEEEEEEEEEQEDLTGYLLEMVEGRNQKQAFEEPPEDKDEED